jgi:hypothetical protein
LGPAGKRPCYSGILSTNNFGRAKVILAGYSYIRIIVQRKTKEWPPGRIMID